MKYYTLYDCVLYLFCRARHVFYVRKAMLEYLEKNPPCNAEDNLRAGLIVIEAWFRGY